MAEFVPRYIRLVETPYRTDKPTKPTKPEDEGSFVGFGRSSAPIGIPENTVSDDAPSRDEFDLLAEARAAVACEVAQRIPQAWGVARPEPGAPGWTTDGR
ncbi:MAG: hypothetical protein GIX03_10775 [Candidatus Eremiobacteraeota bacterium]|nr:hypothetical protein [Candidatus Eremiobacteraeota bacterium]MBC5803454.1 hypothetical protein [Candidatus Eremiobacteraeota bacterium]MBC5823207.1 hypothetical protein [Candidatus Eremiobacteraeota bacterium]